MKYHDYHLIGYEVGDSGEKITLRLELPIGVGQIDRSMIEFSGVAFYQFQHTAGAIIVDLAEVASREVILQNREMIEWCAQNIGVRDWPGNFEQYLEHIGSKDLRGWLVESAIGFYGCIVAKNVSQV